MLSSIYYNTNDKSINWLDYLINPDQLDAYISSNNKSQSIPDLITQVINSALFLNLNNRNELLHSIETGKCLKISDKSNNLRILVLKIISHLHWNISYLYESLQLYQIWDLLEYFSLLIDYEDSSEIFINIEDNLLNLTDIQNIQLFCHIVKIRIILDIILKENLPNKPNKLYTFSIPGQIDQTLIKNLHDAIIHKVFIFFNVCLFQHIKPEYKTQLESRIAWLEIFVKLLNNSNVKLYCPNEKFFTVKYTFQNPQETFPQNDKDKLFNISAINLINNKTLNYQIHYDLAVYYFSVNNMNMAKEHFEHVWVNKNDELFNDCYLTFDLNTLYNYCLACGITTETLDFPVGEIDERKVVDDNHSSLVTKGSYSYEAFDRIYSGIQNAREVLNVLKSNLSTEDELDLNSFQIVYNEIINKQLWSSEDVKKLDILFLLKNIIVRENSALMYASVKKIFGDMTKEILEYFTEIIREIYTQSQQIKDINITRARIRGLIIYLATILVDRTSKNVSLLLGLCEILRANIIPRETNQDIKDQLSNIVNALELSAKKTAKNTSVSDGDTKIAAKSLKSKSTHLLDDPKSYSEDDDLEITNLNMRLLKCKNPWTVKDILLTLSNDYQKEPTFLSRFDDMLPRHLLNSLVNLPTGIRRNYIHLILIKARQCQSTEKYRLAQNLIRCCETELINFQEQYSNSSQNSANKDPLYQNSSLLLKYVRWELLFCRLRIELQNRSAMANDKNSYGLINDTKAFLHNLQAFENDMNILNSEIVCAALIYLLKNEEDEYLTNFFPNPSIFYMNLASCLINLKNEFNKIDIEKKIFTLLDLSPATKIALSKFWDLVNTLFSDPSDLNKNAPSKLPSVISGGQNPNKNKCSTPPPIFSNLATHSASLKFPLDDNSLPGNGILGLGGNAQNQPTSILPLPPPPIFPHPPHHLRYLIQHQHKQNIQRIPLFNSILRIPPPMSNAIRSTPFNMGLNINSHGMDVDFKVGYINNYLSLNGDKILMDFINQLNIIQEPVYMTLIGSCLLKIYSLVKDELCFDFVFPYLQYWPSLLLFPQYKINELEDILTFCTNQALKICSNPTSSRVPWLLLRADMEYVNKNWFTAMGYYSQALFVQTNLGEPSECRKEFKIFSNDMYIRMTKCCVEMESNIEAALICQLTNPVDYARAFQVISQALATTTPDTGSYSNIHNTEYSPYTDQDVMAEDLIAGNDNGFDKNTTKPQNIYNGKQDKFCLASDSLYDMMWDMTLVEYVGSMLTSFENQFKIKRNKLLDIISDPNFNMHNARNILNVAVSYKKSKLLSFLVTKYIINN